MRIKLVIIYKGLWKGTGTQCVGVTLIFKRKKKSLLNSTELHGQLEFYIQGIHGDFWISEAFHF